MSDRLSYEELAQRVAELEEALGRFSRQEQESHRKLDYLEKISRIDGALRSSSDMEIVLWEVLGQVLDIFQCDRAWLVRPCDPKASSWGVHVERTTPEYPGIKERATNVAMTPAVAEVFSLALQASGPVVHGPGGLPLSENTKNWRVQSQLLMAVRPGVDNPWLFGIHQCSYPRTWSPEERELFRETGYHLAMALKNLLTNRFLSDGQAETQRGKDRHGKSAAEESLRESEKSYRLLVRALACGVAEVGIDGTILYSNPAHDKMFGYSPGEMEGMNAADLLPSKRERRKLLDYFHQLATEESEGTPWSGTCLCKDGTSIDIMVDWSYRRNPAGEVGGFSALVRDVTERRRALQALQESEAKFRSLAEESPNMILINSGGRILYANKQWEFQMGYDRRDFYGEAFDFHSLIAPQDREKVTAVHRRHLAGENVAPYDCRLKARDGSTIDTIVTARLISYRGSMATLGIITDITERREVEKALRASEERYRSLVERSHEVIFTLDIEGRFTLLNTAFEEVTGWRVEDWLGRHFENLVHPDYHSEMNNRLASMRRGEAVPQNEIKVKVKNGELLTIEYSSVPIVEDGEMTGIWGIARDVTLQRLAEKDRRSMAALKEREGVGRWLHDHLGADLYNIILIADGIHRRGSLPPSVKQQIEWVTETSREALASIRNYLDFVNSTGAEFTDIVVNMEQYGASILDPLGIEFTFERRGDLEACRLTAVQSFNVYLIYKEALTNIVKHAWASRVRAVVALEGGRLSLIVMDDGRGMVSADRRPGHGRMNIKARADELGADLSVLSRPEGGTRVELAFSVV